MAFDPNALGVEKKPENAPEMIKIPEQPEAVPEFEPTETAPEQIEDTQEQEEQALREAQEIAPRSAAQPVAPKDPVLADVENILATGLGEIYMNLPDARKPAFKAKGEEIAVVTQEMISTGKVKAKRILDLIRDWLKLIPGINRFFLEQEAKIKTDQLVDYADSQLGKSEDQL